MSDFSVVGVLAEALAQHRGWWATDGMDYSDMDAISFQGCACRAEGVDTEEKHSEHVASVVAALPDIAIIELPTVREDENLVDYHCRLEVKLGGVRFQAYTKARDSLAAARAAGGQT